MAQAENTDLTQKQENTNLAEITGALLQDARMDMPVENTISVPLTELSTLGAGVASMLPFFRTVTQTTSTSVSGLYRLANAEVGDVLQMAKNGNYWASLKAAGGKSKLVQLQAADLLTTSTSVVAPINPAPIMMSAALYSIERSLAEIKGISQEIISFLAVEKEAEIEADVETLMNILDKYKYSWDNEHFIESNHKLALDIQRTARKNMNVYQKKVNAALASKSTVVVEKKLNSELKDLLKLFKYYRLSLYSYSLASLLEIMLSGDFKEENISRARDDIEQRSMTYRELFTECSAHLEKQSTTAIDTNILKTLGTASDSLGKMIGSIPVVKNGPVDELLQSGGSRLKKEAAGIETKTVEAFAAIGNPETRLFTEKLDDMIQIYSKTDAIYFDEKRIYLVGA